MLTEENIRFQLDRYYRGIENTRNDRQNIRKWCLTIWLAILGVIVTEKIIPTITNQYLVVILPIVVFWFFEAITATHTLLLEKRATMLERYLVSEGSTPDPVKHLFVSGHYNVSFHEKVTYFYTALVKLETVIFFYTPLIFLSGMVLYIK